MSIKIREIEEQLREIWQGFAQHQPDHAVTRAQVMNLLVYAPQNDFEEEINQVLSDLAYESPGRMILLLRGAGEMSSWVNALCHLSAGGRKQICCEQIVIRGGTETPRQWSSAVLPMLVPDLPTFLWWHDNIQSNPDLLQVLAESVDRLIIDSSTSEGAGILPLMETKTSFAAISDLNWAMLTPWRIALAGLYDHPHCRSCLESLVEIELECETPFEECWQARLFIGWIGSALKWKWGNRPNLINRAESQVNVSIRSTRSSLDGLRRVRLVSKDSRFLISQVAESPYLRCEITVDQRILATQLIQAPGRSLSALLSKELSILGHDQIYEKTIRFLG